MSSSFTLHVSTSSFQRRGSERKKCGHQFIASNSSCSKTSWAESWRLKHSIFARMICFLLRERFILKKVGSFYNFVRIFEL